MSGHTLCSDFSIMQSVRSVLSPCQIQWVKNCFQTAPRASLNILMRPHEQSEVSVLAIVFILCQTYLKDILLVGLNETMNTK